MTKGSRDLGDLKRRLGIPGGGAKRLDSRELAAMVSLLERFRGMVTAGHAQNIDSIIAVATAMAFTAREDERRRAGSAEWHGKGGLDPQFVPAAPSDLADPENAVRDVIVHINTALGVAKWSGFGPLRIKYPGHFSDAAVEVALDRYREKWNVKRDSGGGSDPRGLDPSYDDLIFTRKEQKS